MIEPKTVNIEGKDFVISKVPYSHAREIYAQFFTSALPKIGDYKLNEAMMYKMMSFVQVPLENGNVITLSTPSLVDNHVRGLKMGMTLEAEMLKYNCDFFQDGRISNLLEDFAQNIRTWITETLTGSLDRLFQQDTPPSTN
jgi:hypothetical protein